jgi:tetratricopeptide (TPR) repeat protein
MIRRFRERSGCAVRSGFRRIGIPIAAAFIACSVYIAPVRAQTTENVGLLRAIAAYETGDMSRALALLDSVPVEIPLRDQAVRHLYRGLIHFTAGETAHALESFARAIDVEPELRLDPAIHSPSRVRAYLIALDSVVQTWRFEARAAEAAGAVEEAARTWERVVSAIPSDTLAAQRHAALQARLNRRTPAARPPAVPIGADSTPTLESAVMTDSAAAPAVRTLDPGQAAVLGLLLPGLGEIYTGRPGRGVLVLGGAAVALGVGLLYENVAVRCLTVPINNFCPPDDIISENTERPYLGAGLAAAAAITVLGAIDAYFAARRANVSATSGASSGRQGLRLHAPAIEPTASDVRLALIRVRF